MQPPTPPTQAAPLPSPLLDLGLRQVALTFPGLGFPICAGGSRVQLWQKWPEVECDNMVTLHARE